jgi:polar amino acid transport system substrate-binding protein
MVKLYRLAVAFLFLAFFPGHVHSETFQLAVAANTIDTVVSEVIVKKAYEMLGHEVEIIRLPPKRALFGANAGIYDGDVQRIFSVGDHYPNLLRIDPPINYIDGTGFIKKGSAVDARTWQDLTKYRVGIILGIRFAETNVPKENSIIFHTYDELTMALRDGRIDIGIYPRSNGIYQTLMVGKSDIVPLKTPLATFALYHYVHKKNGHLLPDLKRIFTQFKNQNMLGRIRTQVLDISFKRAAEGYEPCYKNYACYQSVWEN